MSPVILAKPIPNASKEDQTHQPSLSTKTVDTSGTSMVSEESVQATDTPLKPYAQSHTAQVVSPTQVVSPHMSRRNSLPYHQMPSVP